MLLLFWLFAWPAYGQNEAQSVMDSLMEQMRAYEEENSMEEVEQDTYFERQIRLRKFDSTSWKNLTEGIDYNEQVVKPKEKKTSSSNRNFSNPFRSSDSWFGIESSAGRVILFIVIILLLAFVLYKLITGNAFIRNTRIERVKTFRIEDVEEAIRESDLERFLREALESREYRLAIRIYYLMVIKELSEREWIRWRKEKTNHEYLSEMMDRKEFGSFRDVTRLFEYAWYGEMDVQEKQYAYISPQFKNFLDQLKNSPRE
ncbi:MAG: DUF4129 domain-containing protein [Bacteroidota bacterium]